MMGKEQQPRIPVTPGGTYDAQIKWAPDAHDEIERLRGLLARLEWEGDSPPSCPVCGHEPDDPFATPVVGTHAPDCWLAAELGRT
jgi:hypothetical protein